MKKHQVMKKYLLAIAMAASAGGATAQTSGVQLFGVLDMSLRNVKNGDNSVQQLATDGYQNNRWGLRGTEELGSGLKAGFWLEGGIAPDIGAAGAGGKFFNRRSTLGLSGSFGEVRLGRDYVPSYWNLGVYDAFGNFGLGGSLNLVSTLGSGATTLVRTDNGVSYFTPPTLGGFFAHLHVSAGEGVDTNKYAGGRMGYQRGAVSAAVAYSETHTATPDKFKVANVGASYNFGFIKPLLMLHRTEWGARKQTVGEVSAIIPAGPGEFHVGYTHANAEGGGTDANDAQLYAVNYGYFLSKRTTLYAAIAQIRNEGMAAFSVATGTPGVPGRKSTGIDLGIRHTF